MTAPDELKTLRQQSYDQRAWRETMVAHVEHCRRKCEDLERQVISLTHENGTMRKLLGDYAKAETDRITRAAKR